jgi:hypothetical protein
MFRTVLSGDCDVKLSEIVKRPLKLGGYVISTMFTSKNYILGPLTICLVFCMDLGKMALFSLFGIS